MSPLTLGHAGCALPAKISPSCGGPVSVGSFTINRVLARSSISLCATTDRNDPPAIRRTRSNKPRLRGGVLPAWLAQLGSFAAPSTNSIRQHLHSRRLLGTRCCGRERRYARQFRRVLVTHPDWLIRNRLLAPGYGARRACWRPEGAPLSFRLFPWLASPESRVISWIRLFA
jgi:hypothetical protein